MMIATEERIGVLLRAARLVSTVLLAAGVIVSLATGGAAAGTLLVHLGLLIVLATPLANVLVAMVGFAQRRDWRFVLMTLAILGVLAGSVAAALR